MTVQNTADEGRARLSFEIEDDEPEMSKEVTRQKIKQISEQSGWNARAPRELPAKDAVPAEKGPETLKEHRHRGRRTKTGRTFPFNTKIKPETYDQIRSLADEATDKEGRPVSFAEIIERALDRLQSEGKAGRAGN